MKLKRPKGYEASEHQIPVMVGNTEYPIANLRKSAIPHPFIILFGYQDVWHEIDSRKFTATANLDAFKVHIESNSLTLQQLGIIDASIEPKSVEEMNHEHYERLEGMFPGYDYHMISQLHRHYSRFKRTPFCELKAAMTQISSKGISIQDWINMSLESEKSGHSPAAPKPPIENHYITNENGVIVNPDTDYEYLVGGANIRLWTGQFKDGTWGNGLHISTSLKEGVVYPVSVQMKSPTKDKALQSVCTRALYVMRGQMTMGATNLNEPFTEIQNLLNTMTKQNQPVEQATEAPNVPAPETPTMEKEEIASVGEYSEQKGISEETEAPEEHESIEAVITETEQPKRPLSISVIGNLQPEKIQEFKDLKKNQEKIVKANPFVAVKDKESLEKARVAAANLLKASTALDSTKTGLGKITKDALNLLKKMTDKFIEETAGITRTPYNTQKAAIDTYVNAEELRIAKEREAELKRINDRTTELYAIPMVFNGEVYSIGTVYILPSQINDLSDKEFSKLVEQAKVVAIAEKAKAEADKSLLEQIEQLKRELALAKGEPLGAPAAVSTSEAPASTPIPEPSPAPEVRQPDGLNQYVIPDAPAPQSESPAAQAAAPTAGAAPLPVAPQTSQYPYGYEPGTELVPANNKPLIDFDIAYASVIGMNPIPAPFIKCREYFRMGLRAAMTEVDAIMKSTPAEGQPTKPEQIKSLLSQILSE